MLIEAAKGGHTNVVQLLIDYPNSIVMPHDASSASTVAPIERVPPPLAAAASAAYAAGVAAAAASDGNDNSGN